MASFHPEAVIAISLIAACTDAVKGRIYNWLTLPAIVFGMAHSTYVGGWQALLTSVLGIGAGFALYGWMYRFGVLGAGDVKFLMALGAFGGAYFALKISLLGVALGGVMALVHLALKRRAKDFMKRLYFSFLTLFIRELEFQPVKIDRKLKMPFGIAIAGAAVWITLADPFQQILGWR